MAITHSISPPRAIPRSRSHGAVTFLLVSPLLFTVELAHAEYDFGTVDIGPTLTATSGCFSVPSVNSDEFSIRAINESGKPWDDFTVLILTCPSDKVSHPSLDGITFLGPPPTPTADKGTGATNVLNPSVLSQKIDLNSEHFDLPFNVNPHEHVDLNLPYKAGFTLPQFELQLIASVVPEPGIGWMMGVSLIGLLACGTRRGGDPGRAA
ncbi:hypothetical protein [Scleromatobacter humisilvae]|uniref:Uncharacterized protein n=1 Tax=Scleromatobacter humisilvae TaxID=2897159 RepID=A0A9X2C2M0_9BURK|nr:hypothetical protein [Scleromatobacter humisilvae]MCK9689507.1 hypothetical protein [Scleromatobacter humisilvae]